MNIKEKVSEEIGKADLDNALRIFSQWAKDHNRPKITQQLVMLKGRLTKVLDQELVGMLTFSEVTREQQVIAYAILNLLNQVDQQTDETPLADQAAKTPSPGTSSEKRILFLASNPSDTGRLQLEKEFARIHNKIQDNQGRLKLYSRWAVTPGDLQSAILKYRPHLIHFSGHGKSGDTTSHGSRGLKLRPKEASGLYLEDNTGKAKLVTSDALRELFAIFSREFPIEAVIFNACYSQAQAKAIGPYIKYVIGMQQAIEDTAAMQFSEGFYLGLAAKDDIRLAFKLGKNKISLEGMKDGEVPVLIEKGS